MLLLTNCLHTSHRTTSQTKADHSAKTAHLVATDALHLAPCHVNSFLSVLILPDLSAAYDTVNHQIHHFKDWADLRLCTLPVVWRAGDMAAWCMMDILQRVDEPFAVSVFA